MAEMLIGAGAATCCVLLLHLARARGLAVRWWQWVLTFLGLLYGVFVLEVIVSFMREGTPKGAAVMGTLLGFVAVVWAVILGRTVFSKRTVGGPGPTPTGEGGTHG